MVKKSNVLVIAILFLAILGGGLAIREFQREAANKKLEPVYIAASELRGALAVGASRSDYARLLQSLSGAIQLAKDDDAPDEQVQAYISALLIYTDALEVWDERLRDRSVFVFVREGCCRTLRSMASKYGVSDIREGLPRQYAYDSLIQEIWKHGGIALDSARPPN